MSKRNKIGFILPLSLVLASACTEPSVSDYAARSGLIRGTLVYPAGSQRGNVIVSLFEESQLPPPQGTSGPANFVVVPKEQLFAGATDDLVTDFSTSFTIPVVPAGRYQIRAFLDTDGDFSPLYDLVKQPTAGDVGGGYIDLATRAYKIVEVTENEVSEAGIVVTLGQTFPVERPAFAHTGPTSLTSYSGLQSLQIQTHPIRRSQVSMDPAKTAFLIQYVDDNSDGRPDDVNGDHLPDVYPRVLLRRQGENSDICEANATCSVVVPLIVNPTPFLDTLDVLGVVMSQTLDLIVPPTTLVTENGERRLISGIPAGDYDTVVILGTGQTWTVPNNLDLIQPQRSDATQSVSVKVVESLPPTSSRVSGSLSVQSATVADAFVLVFDAAAPPPPAGTGTPVVVASVPRTAFSQSGETKTASFSLSVPQGGQYLITGLYDTDSNLSLLVGLYQQATVGDVTSSALKVIDASTDVDQVDISLDQVYTAKRPVFEFEARPTLDPTDFSSFRIRRKSLPWIQMEASPFDLVLTATDSDNDNLRDLYPRIILSKIDNSSEPADLVVVPTVIEPFTYLPQFGSGSAIVQDEVLEVLTAPLALSRDSDGVWTTLRPIPAGQYRLSVINHLGQTWSVPNDYNLTFGREGTPLELGSQDAVIEVPSAELPKGKISGTISLQSITVPDGDFTVVVTAFSSDNPPPPQGSGRPAALVRVTKAAFAGSAEADYELSGLSTGRYQVRAFMDVNDDFVLWFDTHNQPNQGDIGGGHFSNASAQFTSVEVDALGAPVENIGVSILSPLTYPADRPVFSLNPTRPTASVASASTTVSLRALSTLSDVLKADGGFLVQWADLDGDGAADDVNGDGNPDVFPLVVFELLDENDESNQSSATPSAVMSGIINPAQFLAQGFPAADPTQVNAILPVQDLEVFLPLLAVDPTQSLPPQPSPPGRYRVTVIQSTGQTWSIPNNLQRASGDNLSVSQAGYLTVQP